MSDEGRSPTGAMAVDVVDALRCARPVFFESAWEAAPYYGHGSSTLVSRGGRIFAVTAAHVFDNLGPPPPVADDLRIPYTVEAPLDPAAAFVSHEAVVRVSPKLETDDGPWADLLVAPLSVALTELAAFAEERPIEINEIENPLEGSVMVARGFPIRGIEPGKSTYAPATFIGTVGPPSTHLEFIISLNGKLDIELESYSGMSGGPLIQVTGGGPRFAGVVVLGGNGNLHAVHGRVVAAVLDAYSAGKNETSLYRILPNP